MDRPTLVFAIDGNFALPLAVAWLSLSESNPELIGSADVVLLHDSGLGPVVRGRLRRHAERLGIRLLLCRARLPRLPYNTRFGGARANYLRLDIPRALAGRGRVLYLDADVLVLADLRPLLDVDLAGLPLAAVQDAVNPTYDAGKALQDWEHWGIPGSRAYFNSGVLLLDLPAIARDGLVERAYSVVAERPHSLRLWDQDALNVAAADRWLRLPRRWNTPPLSALRRTPWIRGTAGRAVPETELLAVESAAAVLHFLSPAKPWLGLLPAGPALDLYAPRLAAVRAAESEFDNTAVL